jgi:hypothetical protein
MYVASLHFAYIHLIPTTGGIVLVIDANAISVAQNGNLIADTGAGEVLTVALDMQQARMLHVFSEQIARLGGPQSTGARSDATYAATELRALLSPIQAELVRRFAIGKASALVFQGLLPVSQTSLPAHLPLLADLEGDSNIYLLASRSQILLKLLDHRAFAYDIDNDAKIVRIVANFKGGGHENLSNEPAKVELSSHTGLALGPHTEAPYWCSVGSSAGHSPAPSALILTALWNPRNEPTTIIPMPAVLEKLGAQYAMALTAKYFRFTRSDSFVAGKGEDGHGVSILDFDENSGFSVRYNSYRFSVDEDAPEIVKTAYDKFVRALDRTEMVRYVLQQDSAMVINNCRALHCRDIVKDNRRLLVRLFGYSKYATPIVISESPLIVRG